MAGGIPNPKSLTLTSSHEPLPYFGVLQRSSDGLYINQKPLRPRLLWSCSLSYSKANRQRSPRTTHRAAGRACESQTRSPLNIHVSRSCLEAPYRYPGGGGPDPVG